MEEWLEQLKEKQNHLSHMVSGQPVEIQKPHSSECPKCHGDGYYRVLEDGIWYAVECPCGIRKNAILNNQLKFAEMPESYKNSQFNNMWSNVYLMPESKEIFIQAAKAVRYWFDNLSEMQESGIGLYLYSNTKGSGKTKTVCALANEIMKKYQKTVKFSTSLKIISEIRRSWGESKTAENKLIEELSRAEILIIDDFGANSAKEWINDKFYEIIDSRYTRRKITIFTSNSSISQLNYDERITNRILERSLEIPFPEESVREHIAEHMRNEMISRMVEQNTNEKSYNEKKINSKPEGNAMLSDEN